MKSIAINHVTFSKHQVGIWNTLRKFFQTEFVGRGSALPTNFREPPQEELAFFDHEYELEDYLRSFRE